MNLGAVSRTTITAIVAIVFVACGDRPTAEDRRRVDTLAAEPILHTRFAGVEMGPVYRNPGHGSGPRSTDGDANRRGTLSGDPKLVMRAAVERASATGWIVKEASCIDAESYLVTGLKQFDGYIGVLRLQVVGKTPLLELVITVVTDPANAGGQVSLNETQRQSADLAKSCLAAA